MKQLTCEMCGGTDLVKQDGMYICQTCGVKYSVEEAKKMMIEGTVEVQGTVKVDDSDELKNLYILANRAMVEEDYDKMESYYEQILIKDANSWQAQYYPKYIEYTTSIVPPYNSISTLVIDTFHNINKTISQDKDKIVFIKGILKQITEFTSNHLCPDCALMSINIANKCLDNYNSNNCFNESIVILLNICLAILASNAKTCNTFYDIMTSLRERIISMDGIIKYPSNIKKTIRDTRKHPDICPMCENEEKWQVNGKGKGGFNVGKALIGTIVVGPIGLLNGVDGKNEPIYTCLNCGFTCQYTK